MIASRWRAAEAGVREALAWLPPISQPPSCPWFFTLSNEGGPYLAVAREAVGYRVRVHGVADYLVAPDSLSVEPCEGLDRDTVQVAFDLDVRPVLHQLEGRPALHASAVSTDLGVVAFSGESGVGKSTLAALLSSLPGHRLVADDSVPLEPTTEGFLAIPTASSVRLREPTARALGELGRQQFAKFVAQRAPETQARPLRIIFSLWRSNAVGIDPMSPREAMAFVAGHLQRLDPESPDLLRREFQHVDEVVRHVEVAHLSYPHDFEVAEVARVIDARLREEPRTLKARS